VAHLLPELGVLNLMPKSWAIPLLGAAFAGFLRGKSPGCGLTNIGELPAALEYWNGARLVRASIIAPVLRPPMLFTAASTFRGTCHLVFGFFEGALTAQQADRIPSLFRQALDRVLDELSDP